MAANRSLLLAAALLGVGCGDTERTFAGLDGPGDVALLEPGDFFEVPVAFVSNFRNGRVSKLDLKRTMLLVEDGPAPWMVGPDLAFGSHRALAQIALAQRPGELDVWVSDDLGDELLRAPYARMGEDGAPSWTRPALEEGPTFLDPSGAELSGATPRFHGLRVRPGRATTETWTFTWTGQDYEVRGEASGLQRSRVVPGVRSHTDNEELSFSLSFDGREPERGEQIVLSVGSGVEAADAGGLVLDLLATVDGQWIFAAVLPDGGQGFVSVWDAVNFVELDRLLLPQGAAPEHLSLGADEGVIWIADSAEVGSAGRIHRIDYVPGDVDSIALRTLPVPEPAIDVAEGRDPEAARVFVASAFSDAVWMLDGDSFELLDVNHFTEAIDPMRLRGGSLGTGSPVSGMAAMPGPAETWLLDERGERNTRYGVLATTFDGSMYWMDAATGCLIHDLPANAFLDVAIGNEASTFRDVGTGSNPQLALDPIANSVVSTHPCGGVNVTEIWTFRYREALQAYEVEGNRSGEQQGLCYEGERYTTDGGELSVLILPGTVATSEGDAWSFPINDAVTPIPVQQLPGDPVVFTERYDDRNGAWYKLRERQVAIVPHLANDIVLWVDIAGQGNGQRVYQ